MVFDPEVQFAIAMHVVRQLDGTPLLSMSCIRLLTKRDWPVIPPELLGNDSCTSWNFVTFLFIMNQ